MLYGEQKFLVAGKGQSPLDSDNSMCIQERESVSLRVLQAELGSAGFMVNVSLNKQFGLFKLQRTFAFS